MYTDMTRVKMWRCANTADALSHFLAEKLLCAGNVRTPVVNAREYMRMKIDNHAFYSYSFWLCNELLL